MTPLRGDAELSLLFSTLEPAASLPLAASVKCEAWGEGLGSMFDDLFPGLLGDLCGQPHRQQQLHRQSTGSMAVLDGLLMAPQAGPYSHPAAFDKPAVCYGNATATTAGQKDVTSLLAARFSASLPAPSSPPSSSLSDPAVRSPLSTEPAAAHNRDVGSDPCPTSSPSAPANNKRRSLSASDANATHKKSSSDSLKQQSISTYRSATTAAPLAEAAAFPELSVRNTRKEVLRLEKLLHERQAQLKKLEETNRTLKRIVKLLQVRRARYRWQWFRDMNVLG